MLIDIDKYAILTMDKLQISGFYSEIEPADLLESIRKYLEAIYNDRISVLSLKLDLEQQQELPISSEKYKKEYHAIRSELVDIANEIAMVEKPEIIALPRS